MGGSQLTQAVEPYTVQGSINAVCGTRNLGVDVGKYVYAYLFRADHAAARAWVKHNDSMLLVARWERLLDQMKKAAHQCRLVYYFDGHCPGKGGTKEKRDKAAETKIAQADAAYMTGEQANAGKLYSAACRLTPELAAQLVNVCRTGGYNYVISPEEADAQLAYDFLKGLIWAVIMDDADGIAFDIKRQVLNWTGRSSMIDIVRLDQPRPDGAGWTTDARAKKFESLLAAFETAGVLVFQFYAVVVGSDHFRTDEDKGGVRGVGHLTASQWARAIFCNGPAPRTVDACWERMCTTQPDRGEWTGDTQAAFKSQFYYAMFWLRHQAVINRDSGKVERTGKLRGWAENLAEEFRVPDDGSPEAFVNGEDWQLVPVTVVDFPHLAVPVYVGDVPELIEGGMLPADEADWTRLKLQDFFKTIQGVQGWSSWDIPRLKHEARLFLALDPELFRRMRQDPSNRNLVDVAVAESRASAAMVKYQDDLHKAQKAPPASSFTVKGLKDIAAAMYTLNYDMVKRIKFEDLDVDGMRAVSDGVVVKAYKQYTEFRLDRLIGFTMCIVSDSAGHVHWFAMPMPASQTTAKRWSVVVRAVVSDDKTEYVSIRGYCACPKGDSQCHHSLALIDVIATLPRRMEMLEEEAESHRELTCTDMVCSWHQGASAGFSAPATTPWAQQPIFGITYGPVKENVRGAGRISHSAGKFDPRSALNKAGSRDDPVRADLRAKLYRVMRQETYATRDSWTGKVTVSGATVIQNRHKAGKACPLGVDLFEGASDDERYAYEDVEGWPALKLEHSPEPQPPPVNKRRKKRRRRATAESPSEAGSAS